MRLLLIAPSTRAMAESSLRAGYDFVSIDFFGDADQKEICENYSLSHDFHEEHSIENLVRHRGDVRYTHVVYGAGFENHPELVEVMEKEGTVLGNSASTLRRVRDWGVFFRTLKEIGVAYPETRVVEMREAVELMEDGPWIVKPLKSGGGHDIYDRGCIREAEAADQEVLLQEYVNGTPASATVIASRTGSHFVGITEQLIGDSQSKYRYSGNIVPLSVSEDVVDKVARLVRRIAEVFRLVGSNTVDFILRDDEPVVTEVNPRITGAMEVLEKAYRVNLMRLHVEACLGTLGDFRLQSPRGFHGKKILYAAEDLVFKVNRLAFVKDVPRYGEKIKKGHPVCTVLASAGTRRECLEDLMKKEALIRRHLGDG
jgi:hypothetical protein